MDTCEASRGVCSPGQVRHCTFDWLAIQPKMASGEAEVEGLGMRLCVGPRHASARCG
jgi:hypothetical protein